CQIERVVRAAQQLFGFLCVIGECGNSEGDGDGPERLIVIAKLEPCNFLPKLLGLGARGVERAFGQEHQEFLAAVPACDVGPSRLRCASSAPRDSETATDVISQNTKALMASRAARIAATPALSRGSTGSLRGTIRSRHSRSPTASRRVTPYPENSAGATAVVPG